MNGTTAAASRDLLQQLVDIKGLRAVNMLPLAPGWWIVLALSAVLIAFGIWFYVHRRALKKSWQREALTMLSELEQRLNTENAQTIAAGLAITLRRIAMQKFSRMDCAGLEGQQWLEWLKAHDPRDFNWPASGALLITAPYAPPDKSLRSDAIKPLIYAARRWVQ